MVVIHALRGFAPLAYTNEEIEFIDRQAKGDEEKFYGMIFEDLKNNSTTELETFLKSLNLPLDVFSTTSIDGRWRPLDKIEFEKILD